MATPSPSDPASGGNNTASAPVPDIPSTDALQVPTSLPSNVENVKVDEITAIQDSIDAFSLAMFEALRGLRDAVAPEQVTGNAVGAATKKREDEDEEEDNRNAEPEEFWQKYRSGDAETVAKVLRVNGGARPTTQVDYRRIFARLEREKDAGLVTRLATTVLVKSAQVDERVKQLKGMDRTRKQQMARIEELVKENQETEKQLQEAYEMAMERRKLVRQTLSERTCEALGIEER